MKRGAAPVPAAAFAHRAAKVERSFSRSVDAQPGHVAWRLAVTNVSKRRPHERQVYSKIGIPGTSVSPLL